MIFVIAEDNTLNVFSSAEELQGACEGIDVEEGVYRFFGPKGEPLKPEFHKPNKKGRIVGALGWVVSGQYHLVPATDPTASSLSQALESVVALDRNRHFTSLQEVRKFLTSGSNSFASLTATPQSGAH